MMYPTQETLHELFDYDPTKQEFIRKINVGNTFVGDVAGKKFTHGETQSTIQVGGVRCTKLDLAHIYLYGYVPEYITTNPLTSESLRSVIYYNPLTGKMFWRYGKGGRKMGFEAGHSDCTDETQPSHRIQLAGTVYHRSRLAWLYMKGYFPEHEVDHEDRNPLNDKWSNLRELTRSCNCKNRNVKSTNTSGITGISRSGNSWRAYICSNKKQRYLGTYKSFDNAVCARLAGEQCLDWSNCDSASSAYLYVQKHITKKGDLK